ncbi:MAG: hypothetical protein FD173_2288 [Gallionellaceae bacterium]|nr:MAG: hypothetical protein FD173_2288 [Gallionellaceae bacterium]
MRFFTDQYFSDVQNARVRTSQPQTVNMPIQPVMRESLAGQYSGEHIVFWREAEVKEFEQKSKRIELIFLGSIISVIVVAALLDFITTSHVLAI